MVNRLEQEVKEKLEGRGYTVLRNGWPDFLCIRKVSKRTRTTYGYEHHTEVYGLMGVEVKARGDKVSEDQRAVHRALRAAGIPVYVMGLDALDNGERISTKRFLTHADIKLLKAHGEALKADLAFLEGQIHKKREDISAFYGHVDALSLTLDAATVALEEVASEVTSDPEVAALDSSKELVEFLPMSALGSGLPHQGEVHHEWDHKVSYMLPVRSTQYTPVAGTEATEEATGDATNSNGPCPVPG